MPKLDPQAEADFRVKVQKAVALCQSRGIPTRELWLGPVEFTLFKAITRRGTIDRPTDFMGLVVMRSAAPGLRVGCTTLWE